MGTFELFFYYLGVLLVAILLGWMYMASRRVAAKAKEAAAAKASAPQVIAATPPPVPAPAAKPAPGDVLCSGCGAKVHVIDGAAVCEYCGTRQTNPA
jgi:hypothetical protein